MKEIIVISGGNHKGIVKIENDKMDASYCNISCKLDFVPKHANLYLICDKIVKTHVDSADCTYKLPICANNVKGCMLQSSNITMFGGSLSTGEIASKIERYNKQMQDTNSIDENEASHFDKQLNKPMDLESMLTKDVLEENAVDLYTQFGAQLDITEWTKYDGNNFYYTIKPQLDEMFVCYPACEQLNSAVPNSSWVRVDAEDGNYVVGIIRVDSAPSFICYGVPANSQMPLPQEFRNLCTFVPINKEGNDSNDGYWLIYQSARNGRIVSQLDSDM